MPADSSAAITSASRSLRELPILFTTSGSATNSRIVCFGFSVSYGSWKISCTRRRYSRSALTPQSVETSLPPNTIRPPVWRVSFTTTRPVVVLPDPDSPTRPRISPLRIVRSMPSTARTTPTGLRDSSPPRIGKWTSRFSRRSSSSAGSGSVTAAGRSRPGPAGAA